MIAPTHTVLLEIPQATRRPVRWGWVIAAIAAMSAFLALLPGRTRIPPLIESDYCYLLMAADRMYEGHGPTAPLPVAPFQPWTWQADWGLLTQWPIGYPLAICAIRWVSGLTTIQACQWISVVVCAVALVGWFVCIKRSVSPGVTGVLLAAVAAGCSVSTASLINPSTDALLVALLPFVLLFTTQAIAHTRGEATRAERRRTTRWLVLSGLTAGGLFWIRYAGLFVPLVVVAYLLIENRHTPRLRLRLVAVFALCAAAPVVTLLLINRIFGTGSSMQAQLNLGHRVGFDLSPVLFARAWWKFTDFGFYDYHWFSHWVFALWPIAGTGTALCIRPARRAMRTFFAMPFVTLSTITVVALLAMLIGATAVFGDKFDYVGLDRYYAPIKPLYFLLFVAPIMLIPRRVVRVLACIVLLVACSWLAQQEWPRPYKRWLAANREVTPYGTWSRCFVPDATELYNWLGNQSAPDLIVVSNFHEYIALETRIPALPIPEDVPTLNTWIERICEARRVIDPRVLFILDPENRWRDYWIKPPTEIVKTFGLELRPETPVRASANVFEYRPAL